MKKQINNIVILGVVFILFLSACGPETAATPDADAIATSVVQTVAARDTQQALTQKETAVPSEAPATLAPTATFAPSPTTAVSQGGVPGPACYFAQFVADISIPDGMIMLPGTAFTKTWQIKNIGSCPWDTSHSLYLQSGEGLTTTTSIPLTKTVYPGDVVNLSVSMTAPTAEGVYTGYWRIATPYGGSFGVGTTDTSLIAKITVATRPDDAYAVTEVFYSIAREPKQGCPASGTKYIVTATVVTNGPGEVRYSWYQYPYDGGLRERGKLKFTEAGRQVISWTWNLKEDAVQGMERKVSLFIDEPNNAEFKDGMPIFYWTCP
ncbi:MAG: NBR1-Ig-like domain-containing protein [Anaerolineales bacterium]|jgi:hypothetical protein|nr:NBR1-Ig-like domain-containing protein [Anaerolineales bacterium]